MPVNGLLPTDAEADAKDVKEASKLYSKISYHLLPLFFAMVVLCYVDRTNLAFAAIQLNEDLQFSPAIYGLGSGLFFCGYASLQIPSNIILKNTSANVWLASIIFAWGLTATLFAFMHTPLQFYLLRLLLGVAEAGAFPGMWYYLTRFYPQERLTMAYAVVESGISLSHTVAAPVAAACLSLNGSLGLRGWQWLFMLEGLPTLVLALVMFRRLPESVETAWFLTNAEQRYLASKVSAAHDGGSSSSSGSNTSTVEALGQAVRNPFVWYLGGVKFIRDIAGFGIIFWTPTIVNAIIKGDSIDLGSHEAHTSVGHHHVAAEAHHDVGIQAALLTSVPFALAALFSFYMAHRSQRHNERIMHVATPYMVAGVVFTGFPLLVKQSALMGFACLTVGVIGVYSGSAPGLALLSELAAGPQLVVALPLYNSMGNIGGFVGPFMVGYLVQTLHSFALPTVIMGCCLSIAGVLIACMGLILKLPKGLNGSAKSLEVL